MRDQKEINRKISESLRGKPHRGGSFKRGYDANRGVWTKEHREKAILAKKQKREELYATLYWDELPKREKRRRILAEQKEVCLWCSLSEWRGFPITLELDHVDGNNKNDARDNLRILCPNCHSQTPTYKNKRRGDATGRHN